MNRCLAVVALVLCLAVSSDAAPLFPFSYTQTATGQAFPPIRVVSNANQTLQNGDFLLRPINNASFSNATVRNLGDATEEWTSWTLDFTGGEGFDKIIAIAEAEDIDLTTATLVLNARSGFDTPGDDVLSVSGAGFRQPFGGINQNRTFTRTFNLISLFGEEPLATRLADRGTFSFSVGNDILVYGATLTLAGTSTVPEPGSLTLLATAPLGMLATRRRRA